MVGKGDCRVGRDEIEHVPLCFSSHNGVHRRYPDGSGVLLATGNSSATKIALTTVAMTLVGETVVPGQEPRVPLTSFGIAHR